MRCEEVLEILPGELKEIIKGMRLPLPDLQEIRVRAGRPVLAVSGGREWISDRMMTRDQVGETLAYLSSYSLYAYEDEIRQGFLSLPGGHRVGLAGRAVVENRKVKTITEVASLNIRFAHEVRGCADELMSHLWTSGRFAHTLIVSSPGKGKTTLLRDCIRQISDGSCGHRGMTVGVVDERSEIAGSYRGMPENDVGVRTDVLDGCPKAEGMLLLIRSMAPEVIAVDEIGSREDLESLKYAMHCGCVLLATVHGDSLEELQRKPGLGEMVEEAVFERYVFLEKRGRAGQIRRVLDGTGKARQASMAAPIVPE